MMSDFVILKIETQTLQKLSAISNNCESLDTSIMKLIEAWREKK